MTTTFTIKQVPDELADALRKRAATNRRSLQRELLLILEDTAAMRVSEPPAPDYRSTPSHKPARLSLDQTWERARKLGASGPAAGTAIARDDELLEQACAVLGKGERSAVLREGLKALIEREAARRLIRLGGSAPDARLAPRRRAAPMRKARRVGA
jgi:plasmid stability protein